jgi:predicted Fe-Mo cluster-binding NifX family protein
MTELGPNEFVVTCVEENEDGSANIEVEAGTEMQEKIFEAGINFMMLKGILEGTTEDVLRWAQRGKQEERTDSIMDRYKQARADMESDRGDDLS